MKPSGTVQLPYRAFLPSRVVQAKAQQEKEFQERRLQERKKEIGKAGPLPNHAPFIADHIAALPKDGKAALVSRRKLFAAANQEVPVRGDAMVFLLQKGSTNNEVVETIEASKKRIAGIIGQVDHIKISYPHLSFLGTVAPTSVPKYLDAKLKQTPQVVEKIGGILREFANEAITCKVKECKMNADGHIVARFEINEKEKLLACKAKIAQITSKDGKLDDLYHRYKDDPQALEKQTTLASVMLVVNIDALNAEQKKQLEQELKALNENLQKIGKINLNSVVWKEYEVRNLSEEDTLRTRQYDRKMEDEKRKLKDVKSNSGR